MAALALVLPGSGGPSALAGQIPAPEVTLPEVAATHQATLLRRVEGEVHAALLAPGDEERDRHLAAAEQLARHLTAADTASAEAWYWLAVALGVKTDHSGPLQKLTTGREVFFTTARVLELDSLHAGGHEMMGRLHAAVMRLPWLVRGLALRMGMGQVLGDASWERAEAHFRRAAELDPAALAPRLELAKLYLQFERLPEARPLLAQVALLPAGSEVERRMAHEARGILARLPAARPGDTVP